MEDYELSEVEKAYLKIVGLQYDEDENTLNYTSKHKNFSIKTTIYTCSYVKEWYVDEELTSLSIGGCVDICIGGDSLVSSEDLKRALKVLNKIMMW